jgi:hypothetical protein
VNGPEHYREAEKLLRDAETFTDPRNPSNANIAAAQVHATLALAAATADSRVIEPGNGDSVTLTHPSTEWWPITETAEYRKRGH